MIGQVVARATEVAGSAGSLVLVYVYAVYPALVCGMAWLRRGGHAGRNGPSAGRDEPGHLTGPAEQGIKEEITGEIDAGTHATCRQTMTAIVSVAGEWESLDTTLGALALSRRRPDEVIVALDGQADAVEVARRVEGTWPRGKVITSPGEGKTCAQECAIEKATGSLLALLDAGAEPDAEALGALEKALEDERAGVAAGVLAYTGAGPERAYARFESALRQWESDAGGTLGVHGALSMRRRKDHIVLPPHAITDLVEPLLIHVMRGKPTRVVPEARVHEPCPATTWDRKQRITLRAVSSLAILAPVLDVVHRPLLAWMFISHKLLRWLTWLWVALTMIGLAGGAQKAVDVRAWSLPVAAAIAGLVAGAVAVGRLAPTSGAALPGYALEVLGAQCMGMVAGLLGRTQPAWRPSALGPHHVGAHETGESEARTR